MSLITVEHLNFTYPEANRQALSDINLTVEVGEWVAIVGHNGSGKSTLAKNLIGLLAPDSGTVTVGGLVLSPETVWDIRARVGIVFQNPDNQFVGATVQDDVAFGLENLGVPRDEMVSRVDAALSAVGMADFATREPARLSGGQKQRVAIAGVIAKRPDVIILDESTAMLDPAGRAGMLAIIDKLREETKMTVISITHDLDEVARADRAVLLRAGRIDRIKSPAELFSLGNELFALGLDAPYTEQLKTTLAKRGVTLPADYEDEEGMVKQLWTLHSKM